MVPFPERGIEENSKSGGTPFSAFYVSSSKPLSQPLQQTSPSQTLLCPYLAGSGSEVNVAGKMVIARRGQDVERAPAGLGALSGRSERAGVYALEGGSMSFGGPYS